MSNRGKVISVNISEEKGTIKRPVTEIQIDKNGIVNDAHAGPWHRQVSFLSSENIEKSRKTGLDVTFGDFAENIATSGIDWKDVPIGTKVELGESAVVEITQIGKICHKKCAIYYQAGDCIMPKEGVFARVIQGGSIQYGDDVRVIPAEHD